MVGTMITTALISREQIVEEVPEIVELLRAHGIEDVIVEHGWGSGLEIDELWHPIPVKARDLPAFVERATKEGVFLPGSADLTIRNLSRSVQFTLCHESDIHLVTDDNSLIDQTSRHWSEKGYGVIRGDPTKPA